MPSQSLPLPERPSSLQNQTDLLDIDDEVEEITLLEEATYTYKPLGRQEFRHFACTQLICYPSDYCRDLPRIPWRG